MRAPLARAMTLCLAGLLTVPQLLVTSAHAADTPEPSSPATAVVEQPEAVAADAVGEEAAQPGAVPADLVPTDGLGSLPAGPDEGDVSTARVPEEAEVEEPVAALSSDARAVIDWRRPAMDDGVDVPLVDPDSGPLTGGNQVLVRSNAQLFVDVAAGPGGITALARDGQVISWGKGDRGELGTGATTHAYLPSSAAWAHGGGPQGQGLGLGAQGVYLAITRSMSDAVNHAGYAIVTETPELGGPRGEGGMMLVAWGDAANGRLGLGSQTSGVVATPRHVPLRYASGATTRIVDVAASTNGAVALSEHGELLAWGQGTYGQLGDGTTSAVAWNPVPVQLAGIPAAEQVVRVEAGFHSYYALTDQGHLYAWGLNDWGQLGDGTQLNRAVPVRAGLGGSLAGQPVRDIAVAGRAVLALGADGRMHAWGYGGYGQMGNGISVALNTNPVAVDTSGVLLGARVDRVFASANAMFAVDTDGGAYTWGGGGFGERGDGSLVNTNTASRVDLSGGSGVGARRIVEIRGAGSAGTTGAVVALTSDGRIFTWGTNTYGQLGTGLGEPTALRPTMILHSGLLPASSRVAFGGREAIVVQARGTGQLLVEVPAGTWPGLTSITLTGGASAGVSPYAPGAADWMRVTHYEDSYRYEASPVLPVVITHPASTTDVLGAQVELRAAATALPAAEVRWEQAPRDSEDWRPVEGPAAVEQSERDGLVEVTSTLTVEVGEVPVRYRAVFVNELGSAETDAATVDRTWPQQMAALHLLVTPRVLLVDVLPGRG